MNLFFDEVVRRLVEVAAPALVPPVEVLIVRTVSGRVRLCLRGRTDCNLENLEQTLKETLGAWYDGPIIGVDHGRRSLRPIARALWQQVHTRRQRQPDWHRRWPAGWPVDLDLPGMPAISLVGRWEAEQVAHGKEPWLDLSPARAPWPMAGDAPRITAFYGFKGGVGRTTSLAVLAWRLAQRGQKVLCVDLDLEAPGLTRILDGGAPPREGLLDLLVQHAVTGTMSESAVREVELHGERILLAGAGALGDTYVEKLSRLDTLHRDGQTSPVHQALTVFLQQARQTHRPDHILLDCRAGLHDLAGLAIHDLAHVDVLAGRGDAQELDGLRSLLRRIVARRDERDRRLLVLRTLHPLPLDLDKITRQRRDLYDLFVDLVYAGEPPSEDAADAAHDPCAIGHFDEIARASSLREASPTALFHPTFDALLARLDALWAPEEG